MIWSRRWLHKFNLRIHYDIIDRKPVKLVKPSYNSTWLNVNEITLHFILDIETNDYDVIGVNVFLRKKHGLTGFYDTSYQQLFKINLKGFKVSHGERPQ